METETRSADFVRNSFVKAKTLLIDFGEQCSIINFIAIAIQFYWLQYAMQENVLFNTFLACISESDSISIDPEKYW